MVTRVASASASGTSGTASVVNPAGIIPGDLIILAVAHQNSISSVPTGFSLISSTGQYTYATASVYAKMATAGEPSSYEVATSGSYISVVLAAYRNAKQEFAVSTVGITDVTTSINLPLQGRVAQTASDMEFVFHAVGSNGSEQLPYLDTTGLTPPMFTTVVASSGGSGPAYALWDRQVQGIGTQDTVSVWAQISGAALSSVAVRVIISTQTNIAPDAPTLVAPGDGAALDRQQAQVFDWQFNDQNPGDSQSAYNLAYRITGAPVWTETGWVTSTVTQRTIAGGTFLVGDYEWRVATKDALGVESPWSSTGFFTAADAPPGPTITDPPNGGTISTSEYPVAWSTPDQDAYQLQVIDGETVLFDTGTVTDTVTRTLVVSFPDNNVTRTIQLRVQNAGLWSPWSTVTVTVSYTPPPAGIVSVTANPAHGSLIVSPTFPAPVSPEPAVIGYDVWMRRVGTTGDGIRLAASIPPQQSWEWWLPASGVDYEFRVRGLGGNGTSSWSVWAPGVPVYNLVQNPRGRTTSGTVVVRENLLIRPSADSGTTGWTPGGQANSTITTSTDIPRRSGRPAGPVFKIVANNSGLAFAFTTNTNTPIAQVEETYTFVCYVYVPTGTPNILLDSFGAINADSTIVSTKDAWVRVSATGVAATASAIGLGLITPQGIASQVNAGDAFYVDDMSIEKTTVVNDPFTGSYSPDPDLTPAWTGTVDTSPSHLLGPAPVGWAGGYYSASTDAVKVPASGSSVSVPSGAATLVVFDPTTGQTTYTPTTGGTVAIPGPATVRAAVVPGVYSGPYFDGDSLGAYWLGDEHESVSIIYPVDG